MSIGRPSAQITAFGNAAGQRLSGVAQAAASLQYGLTRILITAILVLGGYALLLLAPKFLPSGFELSAYLLLGLVWLAASLWLILNGRRGVLAVIASCFVLLAFTAWPFAALFVGCYAFNDCP